MVDATSISGAIIGVQGLKPSLLQGKKACCFFVIRIWKFPTLLGRSINQQAVHIGGGSLLYSGRCRPGKDIHSEIVPRTARSIDHAFQLGKVLCYWYKVLSLSTSTIYRCEPTFGVLHHYEAYHGLGSETQNPPSPRNCMHWME